MTLSPTEAVIYLHGLPGSAEEARLAFGGSVLPDHVHVLDRLVAQGDDFGATLLAAFDRVCQPECILIGFSLGAMSALMLAARCPEKVSRVVLISPAAPLDLGDFLPRMAGRPVFEAARRGSWALSALSMVQSAVTRYAPEAMLDGMFREGPAAELELASQPAFRRAFLSSLRFCIDDHRAAYQRELITFVRPWSAILGQVRCRVEIWHGAADNWAPPEMAQALRSKLAGRVDLQVCQGLGHFSTLHHTLARVIGAASPS